MRTISREDYAKIYVYPLRGHTPGSHKRDEDMVHSLWRHRGIVNYNGPKVERKLLPASIVILRAIFGYMLGTPSILRYLLNEQ